MEQEVDNITGISIGVFCCCLLSFCSSLYVVYKYISINYKTFSGRMIFLICLSSWGWSLNQIVTQIVAWSYKKSLSNNLALCDVQGYFQAIYFLTTFFWLYCLIRGIYQKIVGGKFENDLTPENQRRDLIKRLFILGGFFAAASFPIYTESYIPIQPLKNQDCFLSYVIYKSDGAIQKQEDIKAIFGTIWRVLFIIIPQPILIVYQCFAVYFTRQKIQKVKNEKSLSSKTYISQEDVKHFNRMLILYPCAMVLCWTPLYIQRLGETLNISIFLTNDENWFVDFAYIMISLEGFFNAFIYGIDIRRVFQKNTQKQVEWPDNDQGNLSFENSVNQNKNQEVKSIDSL